MDDVGHFLNRIVHQDPITTSWLLALGTLFGLVVVVPLVRLIVAGVLYAVAALSGRKELRITAGRVMPRMGHLLGSLVVGVASVAAPAVAQPHSDEPLNISIDRVTDDLVVEPVAAPVVEGSPAIYVVRTGDSLWSIAAEQLDNPTDAEVTEAWKAIWRANRKAIGDRPELIHPGTELVIEGIST